MTFEQFKEIQPKIKNKKLPGQSSQFKMSPPFREELVKKFREKIPNAKRAGVMSLFYPNENGQCMLCLILRRTYKGVHSAQVGFPGGQVEIGDKDIEYTALRETEEEVGVKISDITVLRKMTEIYIPPSNFLVQPFIGITWDKPEYVMQEAEVEAIIEVSLNDLLNEEFVVATSVMTSLNVEIIVPAYKLNGHIVWGATAMMLGEIKDLILEASIGA